MKDCIITFDVGTTAIKTSLFDRSLTPITQRNDEYSFLDYPDRIEIDPQIYWDTICNAVSNLGFSFDLTEIAAICLTTQGETLIAVDQNGTPLYNAIVWLDNRAEKQAKKILSITNPQAIHSTTGVTEMNGTVPLAKLLWFKEVHPELYQKTAKFLLLEDYLLFRLTGQFVTEKSLLTSTAYFDIHNEQYWTEILTQLSLDRNKLPNIVECGQDIGPLTQAAAEALGVSQDVHVFTGAMDQIAASIGGGGLRHGIATATIGTALVLTSLAARTALTHKSSAIIYRGFHRGQQVLLTLCPTAGAVFKWFKDQFCSDVLQKCATTGQDPYDLLCTEAAFVPPGANGVTVIPYFAGCLQPNAAPNMTGSFFGIELTTQRSDITRAILESVGYMLRENLQFLNTGGCPITRVHFFGGGAKNTVWCQILADITGVELAIPTQTQCGSLGAAILAAVGLGWYPSIETAQSCNQMLKIVTPNPTVKEHYDKAFDRYLRILETVHPLFHEERMS